MLRGHPNRRPTLALLPALLLAVMSATLLFFATVPLHAQSTEGGVNRKGDEIDSFVLAFIAERGIPGAAVAVLEDGKLLKVEGYGMANVELEVPVTTETLFQSGSLGKQFTAAAILLLAEDGRLTLDDKLCDLLADCPSSWSDILIRQLLNHTAGLPEIDPLTDERKDYTDRELIDIAASEPLLFEPGSAWAYSNTAYVVLGSLLSEITGEHWSEFVKARIFEPAGMKTAQRISLSRITPNRASAYVRIGNELKNAPWFSQTFLQTGDGALYFSIMDLAHWDQALRRGEVLSSDSYEQWWQGARLTDGNRIGYGFGWEVHGKEMPLVVEHGGIFQGFHAYLIRFAQPELTVAVLANAHFAEGKHQAYERDLALGIVAIQRPELADRPNFMTSGFGDLSGYVGTYSTPEGTALAIRASPTHLLVEGLSDEAVPYYPTAPGKFANSGPDMFFAKRLEFPEGSQGTGWFGYWPGSPLMRIERKTPEMLRENPDEVQ